MILRILTRISLKLTKTTTFGVCVWDKDWWDSAPPKDTGLRSASQSVFKAAETKELGSEKGWPFFKICRFKADLIREASTPILNTCWTTVELIKDLISSSVGVLGFLEISGAKDSGGLSSMHLLMNSSPLTNRTNPHLENHRACSVQGSSSGCQFRSPPSQ